MINFKSFHGAILGILGLSEFAKKDDGKIRFSDDEKATLKKYDFSDAFIRDFEAHLNAPEPESEASDSKKHSAAVLAAALGKATTELNAMTLELDKAKADNAAAIKAKETEIASLDAKIRTLVGQPEPDAGEGAGINATPSSTFNLDDDRQLGGMSGVQYSLERPYNCRARATLLATQGVQSFGVPMASQGDFKSLQEDLGAFYRTPWQTRLQSLLVELPTITRLFPTESGHQDLETLINLWLGEFSQADNTTGSDFDKVAKGSYSFSHETLRMYDVMFVYRFRDLKVLEKSWIGYLNREGSSALKLSFIEYILAETSRKLHNEREQRYVNGVRKEPDPNKPGRAMAAADGIYEYLRKLVDGHTDFTPNGGTLGKFVYQVKPFPLPKITPSNIGEVIYQGTSMVPSYIRDTGNLVLYLPSFMIPWYNKYNEIHYGRNADYKANIDYVKEFPSVKIEAVPNADNHHRIFWTIDGNIKTFDNIPGEMFRYNMEQEDWSLKVWSEWKESIQATAAGRKFTDRRDMDGTSQLIWCNDYDFPDSYFVDQPAGENPSVLLHTSVSILPGESEFAVTDIKDAEVGQLVTLRAGGEGEGGISIAKSGKFSLISDDWNPKKGDSITLMKRADGKFVEIARQTTGIASYEFPADETTPSVLGATVFVTGANTKATALTDLQDAETGTVYTIYGSGSDNLTSIASGGKFVLTEAMSLKEGSFIKLVAAEDGNFYEVARG